MVLSGDGDGSVIRRSTAAAVVGVAAVAAVASYEHACGLVRARGESGWTGHWRLASELARGVRGGNVGAHGAVLVEAHRSGRHAETPPAAGLRPGVGGGGEGSTRGSGRPRDG